MTRPVEVSTIGQGGLSLHEKELENSQNLPQKDVALLQTLMKLSEDKMYNRALKIANDILKRHPNHGETLSMKAMMLYYTNGDKAESMRLAKLGLKANIQSSTCWHVLGILNRSEKNYAEALRYFRQAHRLSPDILLLLRDLATLQTHQRDLSGLLETRKKVIILRPNLKLYWVAYAVANHLMGYYLLARYLVDQIIFHFYESRDQYSAAANPHQLIYEEGELRLYLVSLLEEAGKYNEAIKYLEKFDGLPDRIGRLETLGRLYIYTGNYEEAHKIFMELFCQCTPNFRYLLCAFVTHKAFYPNISFPSFPLQDNGLNSQPPEHHANTGCTSIQDVQAHTPVSNILLYLSPYALQSPRLSASGNFDWCFHPKHLQYPSHVVSKEISGESLIKRDGKSWCNAFFSQLRPMTCSEETQLTHWVLSQIPTQKSSATDLMLRFLLDFLETPSYFSYFADCFMRRKLAKATPLPVKMIEALLYHPTKSSLLKKIFKNYVFYARKFLSQIKPLDETINFNCFFGQPSEIPVELVSSAKYLLSGIDHHLTPLSAQSLYPFLLLNFSMFPMLKKKYFKALDLIDEAINHSPTIVDLYLIKAHILKTIGNVEQAADMAIMARNMDLADRYTNTECVKYCLQAGIMKQADIFSVFHTTEKKKENLIEMQSMRYELLYGKAALREGNLALALQYFYHVVKHFKDIHDDQLDFHLYALHTGALRHYIQFLRMQNRLHAHRFFRKAAFYIINILLNEYLSNSFFTDAVHSKPRVPLYLTLVNTKSNKETSISSHNDIKDQMTSSFMEFNSKQETEGKNLLKANGDLLAEAWKIAKLLRHAAQLDPWTHCLVYQIAFYQDQLLFMAQSLYRLWVLVDHDIYNPLLSPLLCHFIAHVSRKNFMVYDEHTLPTLNYSSQKQVDRLGGSLNSFPEQQDALFSAVCFVLKAFFNSSNGYSYVENVSHYALLKSEFLKSILSRYTQDNINLATTLPLIHAVVQCLCIVREILEQSDLENFETQLTERLRSDTAFQKPLPVKHCVKLYRLIATEYPHLLHNFKTILQAYHPSVSLF